MSAHAVTNRVRTRNKPESLARIKGAARKLFVERGYHATRPQDITLLGGQPELLDRLLGGRISA